MNYYQLSEKIDDLKFLNWANKLNIFSEMLRLPLMSRVDWICKTAKGITVNCELKCRLTFAWDTLFIEPSKWNYLVNKWNTEKIIPFYINFCDDLTYVFDLRKVGKPKLRKNIKIWDHGAYCFKYEDRLELEVKYAYKYKNGVRIKDANNQLTKEEN